MMSSGKKKKNNDNEEKKNKNKKNKNKNEEEEGEEEEREARDERRPYRGAERVGRGKVHEQLLHLQWDPHNRTQLLPNGRLLVPANNESRHKGIQGKRNVLKRVNHAGRHDVRNGSFLHGLQRCKFAVLHRLD